MDYYIKSHLVDKEEIKDNIEYLAEIEHRRWMLEKYADGWNPGETRNDTYKINPLLKHWDKDTDESKKANDKNSIKLMQRILNETKMKTYNPQPLDTSCVELSADLLELTELLAKNTHGVWAKRCFAEGWKYGAMRNDERKEHPCLVVYEELSEREKEYDRKTATETLKVIMKLGFNIKK